MYGFRIATGKGILENSAVLFVRGTHQDEVTASHHRHYPSQEEAQLGIRDSFEPVGSGFGLVLHLLKLGGKSK